MYPNSDNQVVVLSMLRKSTKILFFTLPILILQGCGEMAIRDLQTFVDTAYQDKKPEIEPLPVIEPFKPFEYASSELSDPYSRSNIINLREDESRVATQRDNNRRREALEEFPLDSLAMVGTLSKDGTPWVIVQTNKGTAHLATVGNYLGTNEGKIKEIFPDKQSIVIEESVLDPAGRLVAREVEIAIDKVE